MSGGAWHITLFLLGNITASYLVSMYVIPRIVHWLIALVVVWHAYRASKLTFRARRERAEAEALRKRLEA